MKTADINTTLIDGYLRLLGNLSPSNKLDLISKLSLSMKNKDERSKKKFYESFGAWDSKESAEEIIDTIRKSRTFNRQNESF